MSKKIRVLETERLILREIEEEDADTIVQWRSDPEAYQYFFSSKAITKAEHLNWYFNSYVGNYNRIDFIAIEKEFRKKIGTCNIKRNRKDKGCAEIGYLLDKSAQGKGYAQESVKRLMLFAKEIWGCERAILSIHEGNEASRLLARRLGFKEGYRMDNFILYYAKLTNITRGGLGR